MVTKKKVKVEVTKQDIARGIKRDGYSCPVARAMKRTLHRRKIWVGWHYYQIGEDGAFITLPPTVTQFVKAFDSGKKVEPFTFEVDGSAAH